MDTEHLELLCTIAHTRSLSEAAKVHAVTQSAASQMLLQIERRLGTALFDRRKRPLELTDAGRMFIGGLQPLLRRFKALEEELGAARSEVQGTVRIAAIYSVGHLRLGRVLQEFGRRYPKAKVELSYLHPAEIYRQTLLDEIDVGIVSCPERRKGLTVTPWIEQEMALVCPCKGPLGEIERFSRRALLNHPFVAFSKGLAIRRMIDLFLRQHEIKVKVVCEFDNIDTMKCAVEEQLGVSILPLDCVTRETTLGTLRTVELSRTPLRRQVALIQREDAPSLRARGAMIELLRENSAQFSAAERR